MKDGVLTQELRGEDRRGGRKRTVMAQRQLFVLQAKEELRKPSKEVERSELVYRVISRFARRAN